MRYLLYIKMIVFLAVLLAASSAAQSEDHLYVIAHPNVSVDKLTPTEVNRIFLLKQIMWENGDRIIPVNREASSDIRIEFSKDVLKASLRSLSKYWNQMQYTGHMPPVIQESDEAMLAFIRNVPGSIGYIRADNPPENVRILVTLK